MRKREHRQAVPIEEPYVRLGPAFPQISYALNVGDIPGDGFHQYAAPEHFDFCGFPFISHENLKTSWVAFPDKLSSIGFKEKTVCPSADEISPWCADECHPKQSFGNGKRIPAPHSGGDRNAERNVGSNVHAAEIETGIFIFANADGSVRSYSGCRMIFDRFKRRHNLDKYNIHFHGLRHTFSNMLFEINENPKVIQQLLGHRDVKTTITVYNSVNSEYVREATDRLNTKIQEHEKEREIEQDIDDDLSDEEIERQIRELERL